MCSKHKWPRCKPSHECNGKVPKYMHSVSDSWNAILIPHIDVTAAIIIPAWIHLAANQHYAPAFATRCWKAAIYMASLLDGKGSVICCVEGSQTAFPWCSTEAKATAMTAMTFAKCIEFPSIGRARVPRVQFAICCRFARRLSSLSRFYKQSW